MAESMKGLHRTHRCAEVVGAGEGAFVTVMGWVQRSRNKGGIIFTDLRDRSGILQIVFEEDKCGTAVFERAAGLRAEYCIAVEGTLEKREAPNKQIATGESYGIVVSKDNPKLTEDMNKAIKDMKADGTIAKIMEKWFGGNI